MRNCNCRRVPVDTSNNAVAGFGNYAGNVSDPGRGVPGRRPPVNVIVNNTILPSGYQQPHRGAFGYLKNVLVQNPVIWNPGGAGGLTGNQTQNCYIYSPSNRLRINITAAVEPNNGQTGSAIFGSPPTFPQWFITAMSKNPVTGQETELQLAYPATGTTTDFPDGFEADSAETLYKVTLNISDTLFDGSTLPTSVGVKLALIATWEPNVQTIKPYELQTLYNACSISPTNTLIMARN